MKTIESIKKDFDEKFYPANISEILEMAGYREMIEEMKDFIEQQIKELLDSIPLWESSYYDTAGCGMENAIPVSEIEEWRNKVIGK